MTIHLHLLFVEDNPEEYKQIIRQITEYFDLQDDLEVHIDGKQNFEDAMISINNPHIRYDLIISDTYRGDHANRDAAVLELVDAYRKNNKFCPLIVCSSGVCPSALESSAFVNWVEKDRPENLDKALTAILGLGIPQLARSLHNEIDSIAGDFLWTFLEKNWKVLDKEPGFNSGSLERLIRGRAAMVLNDLVPGGGNYSAVTSRHGLEYYIYPSLDHNYYSLGDIIKNKDNPDDMRVILTPHCHLYKQQGQPLPKAEYVLTVKTELASSVLGEKLENLKKGKDKGKKLDKIAKWACSPSQTERKPAGRHWYLPHFLEVPHAFCDFLQVESIDYDKLESAYECIATLTPPYAEAMQQSFASFYGSVGIPNIDPKSILDILE
ncbi:MAG: hypothetical protein QM484_04515 [Woeseiaceae bacterium]